MTRSYFLDKNVEKAVRGPMAPHTWKHHAALCNLVTREDSGIATNETTINIRRSLSCEEEEAGPCFRPILRIETNHFLSGVAWKKRGIPEKPGVARNEATFCW